MTLVYVTNELTVLTFCLLYLYFYIGVMLHSVTGLIVPLKLLLLCLDVCRTKPANVMAGLTVLVPTLKLLLHNNPYTAMVPNPVFFSNGYFSACL